MVVKVTAALSFILILSCLALLKAGQAAAYSGDFEPQRVAVKFKPEYKSLLPNPSPVTFGLPEPDRTLAAIQARRIRPMFITDPKKYKSGLPDLSLIYVIEYGKGIPPQTAADLMAQHKYFEYAEPVPKAEFLAEPNDPNYAASTYLHVMNAAAAWDIHKGENDTVGVVIATVDTGSRWYHPDLAENIWNNLGEDADGDSVTIYLNGSVWAFDPGDLNGIDDDGNGYADDLIGWDFAVDSLLTQGNDPGEASGHGTTVSAIANQRTDNGLYSASLPWNLKLMPISCYYPGGSGIYNGYQGVVYAAENGADVINCSWGGTSRGHAQEEAIQYAYGLGSIIVAAAGNSGASILYPAAYPEVVGVSSVWNTGEKVSFSAYGVHVDVCAPANNVWALTYCSNTGYTSYAAPVATALAALIKSAHQDWTQEQVITQLIGTCTNIDSVNASYVNQLGDGLLNAHAALTEINPLPEQELRLAFNPDYDLFAPADANANHALERNETFSLNLRMRNYTFGVSSANVTYTLSTTDPAVNVLNNIHYGSLPADGYYYLDSAFLCQVSATAATKYVAFTLTVNADVTVTTASSFTFYLLVNPAGNFVWEGYASRDNSGRFIRDWLTAHGYANLYSTRFPTSLHGFSAVFLSFGAGSYTSRLNRLPMFNAIRDYLLEGGKIYIEGNDVLGFDLGYYLPDVGGGQSAAGVLWPLLGLAAADDGQSWPNVLDHLQGQEATAAHDLDFYGTNQVNQNTIDRYTPSPPALPAFTESDYACVAAQNYGSCGRKSFVFSYCLAELKDSLGLGTRDMLLQRIMADFTTAGNTMIGIPKVTITPLDGSTVKLSWPAAVNSVYYSVFQSDDPFAAWPDDWIEIYSMTTGLSVDIPTPPSTPVDRYYRVTATGN